MTLYYIRTDNTVKNSMLHIFAATNSNFEKVDYFRHSSSYNRHVHEYQFSAKMGLVNQSKMCKQNYLQKNRKLHKVATCNLNFKKIEIFGHALGMNRGHMIASLLKRNSSRL